jgi:predicted nucleic acid-binding protein
MRFVDTNVFLRYLTRDDPDKAAASYALLLRVRAGQETAYTSEATVAEIAYVLSSPRLYGLSHADIAARLKPALRLRGLRMPHKRTVLQALSLYAAYPHLDFEDALALAHMTRLGIDEIVSYDRGFDRVAGITRQEP